MVYYIPICRTRVGYVNYGFHPENFKTRNPAFQTIFRILKQYHFGPVLSNHESKHSMLRKKMNLFSCPCIKPPKMIVITCRETENAFRKISHRRSSLHKIFKNCQIYTFFNFLAEYDNNWVINVSH